VIRIDDLGVERFWVHTTGVREDVSLDRTTSRALGVRRPGGGSPGTSVTSRLIGPNPAPAPKYAVTKTRSDHNVITLIDHTYGDPYINVPKPDHALPGAAHASLTRHQQTDGRPRKGEDRCAFPVGEFTHSAESFKGKAIAESERARCRPVMTQMSGGTMYHSSQCTRTHAGGRRTVRRPALLCFGRPGAPRLRSPPRPRSCVCHE